MLDFFLLAAGDQDALSFDSRSGRRGSTAEPRRLFAMLRPLMPVEPNAVREIPHSFGWADHAIRKHLSRLTPVEIALYFFLILAADRHGLSCWRMERIARELGHLDFAEVFAARETLTAMGLVAYRPWSTHCVDGVYQVLPVPKKPAGLPVELGRTPPAAGGGEE